MNEKSKIILYQAEDGTVHLNVRFENETLWLSQKMMADLFQKDVRTISEHIGNILKEEELEKNSVIRKFRITAADGKDYDTAYYNLDMIFAVGYRVRSQQGVRFRHWATKLLKEYLQKGFVIDDVRLKNPKQFGDDYFDELLERIRDIRASEKRFYQKIRDIYKLAIDYDPKEEATIEFFKIIQNKLHFAVTGHTAAELIYQRADADKDNMGLTSWEGVRVKERDITIAKNFLQENELKDLNRLIGVYLDLAEGRAKEHHLMYTKDWRELLDIVIKLDNKELLKNAGKISAEIAREKAKFEYNKYKQNLLEKDNRDAVDELIQIANKHHSE
jgi:hypothetical protein